MYGLDLDECIEKLKRRELLREEILEAICELVKEVLMRESNVVHVAAPITVVGDIHGYTPHQSESLMLVNFLIY
jgi:serine/threonine-protein phosphatase PPG1